jgi:hypothetical protein
VKPQHKPTKPINKPMKAQAPIKGVFTKRKCNVVPTIILTCLTPSPLVGIPLEATKHQHWLGLAWLSTLSLSPCSFMLNHHSINALDSSHLTSYMQVGLPRHILRYIRACARYLKYYYVTSYHKVNVHYMFNLPTSIHMILNFVCIKEFYGY